MRRAARAQGTIEGKGGRHAPAIAIDMGATNLRIALVSPTGIIRKIKVARMPQHPPDSATISGRIIRLVHALASADEIASCAGIGIGAAGPIDPSHAVVVRPPNIPLPAIHLAEPLAAEFNLPVRLVNDCCAGLLGEAYFGAGRGCRNFVYLTISTGIGAGIIANGTVVAGRDGNAGEVGHFFVDSDYGLTCGCGGTGHWEGYAAGRFLPRFYHAWRERNGMPQERAVTTAAGIFRAVRKGTDPAGHGFIRELGRVNARGIADVIVAYDPEKIVLDGAVAMKNRDLVIPPVLASIDSYLPVTEITVSSLAGRAPVLGASVIARGYDTRFGTVG